MKTYEELKAMTTEDLVRYAIELQENLEFAKKEREAYSDMWIKFEKKLKHLKEAITNISLLA